MATNTWGPHLWASIHHIALFYPEAPDAATKKQYKQFFLSLGPVIPCYSCSQNYNRHLSELPIDDYLSSRDRLFEWTVLLHNIVNVETKKPQMSLERARSMYNVDGTGTWSSHWTLFAAALIVCVPLGIIGLYRNNLFSRYSKK